MTYAETTLKKQGAATNRRTAKKNPYELLVSLREEDPTASWDRLFREWRPRVEGDEQYLEAVLRYAWVNFTSQYDRDTKAPRHSRKKASKDERQQIAHLVSKVKGILLMELVLPNGKQLGKATFHECSLAGGWFKLVATKGKPSETVGQVLTEEDLHKIK